MIKSRRFKTPQAPQLCEYLELHHLPDLDKGQSGFPVAPAQFHPESNSLGTPQGIRATFPHLANKRSASSLVSGWSLYLIIIKSHHGRWVELHSETGQWETVEHPLCWLISVLEFLLNSYPFNLRWKLLDCLVRDR